MKRVVRHLLVVMASSAYLLLLFALASSMAMRLTFAEPDNLKSWIKQSGVYETIVRDITQDVKTDGILDDSNVLISTSDVVSAAQTAFPSNSLQRDAETVIDGFYAWFKGHSSSPEFRVDVSNRKQSLARLLRGQVERQLSALPECEESGRFSAQAVDILSTTCLPSGFDASTELDEFEQSIATNPSFLEQAIYTGGDLRVSDSSGNPQRLGTALPWVPRAYSVILWLPWVLLILTLLMAVAVVMFSSRRRKGFRRFAYGLTFSGVILLVSWLFISRLNGLVDRFGLNILSDQQNPVNSSFEAIFSQGEQTIARYALVFGLAYLSIGLVTYAVLILTRGSTTPNVPDENSDSGSLQMDSGDGRSRLDVVPKMSAQTTPYDDTPIAMQSANLQSVQAPSPRPVNSRSTPQPQFRTAPGTGTESVSRRPVKRRPPMIQG